MITIGDEDVNYDSKTFFNHARQLLLFRNEITDSWSNISQRQLDEYPDLDRTRDYNGKFILIMRQKNISGGFVESFDQLYEAASKARPLFQKFLKSLLLDLGLSPYYSIFAPLKDLIRAKEKAKNDYDSRDPGHGERWLYDIVRGALVFEEEDDIVRVLHYLNEAATAEVIRIKNRFKTPTVTGFRDIVVNIRLCSEKTDVPEFHHICEIQLHHRTIMEIDAAHHSHMFYEYFRAFFRGNDNSVKTRVALLENVFFNLGKPEVESTIFVDGIVLIDKLVKRVIELRERKRMKSLVELLELTCEQQLALEVMKALLELDRNEFGSVHSKTLGTMFTVGLQHRALGQFERAKEMLNEVMNRRQEILGGNHQDTLTSLDGLGSLMLDIGEYSFAVKLFRRALKGREEMMGMLHLDTLYTARHLGVALKYCGDFSEAKIYLERSWNGKKIKLGQNHLFTLMAENDLGQFFRDSGDCERAKVFLLRVFEVREKLLGPDHRQTLSTVHDLGKIAMLTGELDDAEFWLTRAYKGRENTLGRDHPRTLSSLNALGLLAKARGSSKYMEAENYLSQAFDGRKTCLGDHHPETLKTMTELGTLQMLMRKFHEAEPLLQRAYDVAQKLFGSDHETTLQSAVYLANLFFHCGELHKARPLLESTLERRGIRLAAVSGVGTPGVHVEEDGTHPTIVEILSHYGRVMRDIGERGVAEVCLKRAFASLHKMYGRQSPQLLSAMYDLGKLYLAKEEFSKAKPFYDQALRGQKKTLGDYHEDTQLSATELSAVLRGLGDLSSIKPLYQLRLKALEHFKSSETRQLITEFAEFLVSIEDYSAALPLIQGELKNRCEDLNDPDTLKWERLLGIVWQHMGVYPNAIGPLQRAVRGREAVHGPNHPDTLTSVNDLGNLLREMGENEQAKQLYERALSGREALLGADHLDTLVSVSCMGKLLRSQEEYLTAAAMFRRVVEGREKRLGSDHPYTQAAKEDLMMVLAELAMPFAKPPRGTRGDKLALAPITVFSPREVPVWTAIPINDPRAFLKYVPTRINSSCSSSVGGGRQTRPLKAVELAALNPASIRLPSTPTTTTESVTQGQLHRGLSPQSSSGILNIPSGETRPRILLPALPPSSKQLSITQRQPAPRVPEGPREPVRERRANQLVQFTL